MPVTLSDPVRERIHKSIVKSGIPMAQISRRCGRDETWLSKYLTQGTRPVKPEMAQRIARAIGSTADQLLGTDEPPTLATVLSATTIGGRPAMLSPGRTTASFRPGARDLPLWRGVSVGGAAVTMVSEGPAELTERPAVLAGVQDGFAVQIGDDRCKPRYRRGDVLHFNRGSPAEAEDCVAVQLNDGRLLIGILVAIDEEGVTLRSLNPSLTVTFGQSEIAAMAREIGVVRR